VSRTTPAIPLAPSWAAAVVGNASVTVTLVAIQSNRNDRLMMVLRGRVDARLPTQIVGIDKHDQRLAAEAPDPMSLAVDVIGQQHDRKY
jgi:hypothetical protein